LLQRFGEINVRKVETGCDDGQSDALQPGEVSWTRRRLVSVGLALPLSGVITAGTIRGAVTWHEGEAASPALPEAATSIVAYEFLTPLEARFIESAVARLIPADELGVGAVEAGVPTFIDRQLAGDFGLGSRWYMQGPWSKGEPTQGYQSRMTPAALYRAAIREIDAAVASESGSAFAEQSADDQDAWLHRLEDGKLDLPTADAKAFFKMLWQNTQEGFWADPIYGGNRAMAGWKLIGFPGARYDHSDFVLKHGEPYPLPPVGLKGRADPSTRS
jgi:gluconate 2-dehydrogenase gamma chain